MLKDRSISQSLIDAVSAIGKTSAEKYFNEQKALQEKMAAKRMKMPAVPAPKADAPAHSGAADMANKNMKEEAGGTKPTTPKEKALAKLSGNPNLITHGDVMKGRGVRKEGWDDMLKAAKERRAAEGTGKFDKKTTSTGTVYTRKSETFDDGGKDTDMKKAEKKMKKEEIDHVEEGILKGTGEIVKQAVRLPFRAVKRVASGVADTVKDVGDAAANIKKKFKEEVEQIDEISRDNKSKMKGSGTKLSDANDPPRRQDPPPGKPPTDRAGRSYWGESKDTPGNGYEHQCAVHVKSEQFGEGKTLFSQHAEPDAEGNIAWYDVMFAEGIKRVETKDIEITMSESHMNHKKKK
jgi:hypothetical protein